MSQEDKVTVSPTVWNYNGGSFELDLGDADDAEHVQAVFERFSEAEKVVRKDGSLADQVRAYDKLFRNMFNDMFGDGAGDAILGDRKNINNCDDAYESFLAFINGQNEHFIRRRENLDTKYSGNRAQRRAVAFRHG